MLGGVGMKEDELKQYYSVFTSAWKFFRKYSDVKDSDEYWESVVSESGEIVKGYENSRLLLYRPNICYLWFEFIVKPHDCRGTMFNF